MLHVEGDLYNILKDYLQNRKQGVVLNGQSSSWLDINVGVPEGSVLGPLLFILYINDLPQNVVSLSKLFSYVTSIFSTILNGDLSTITKCAFKWKITFNPDPNKQYTEVIFSRKTKPVNLPIQTSNHL